MANEFKIRKGLIVEGASGGTVVDVQGSQGQLFSVTDNLSGSIFAVSDISGVPILDVNSSGLVTIDGPLTQTGGGDSNFSGDIILQSATPKISLIDTDAGDSFSVNNFTGNFVIKNDTDNIDPLIINGANNATFAGDVSISGGDLNVGNSSTVNSVINMLGTNDSFIEKDTGNHLYFANNVGDKDIRFRVKDDTTNVIALTINGPSGGDSTFSAQAFSAATSSGDASSTLTTKGYVDGLITGATIYRGTWQAGISATSSGATTASTTLTVSAAILDAAGDTPDLVGAVVTGAGITGTVKVATVTSSTVYELDTAIDSTATAYIFSPIHGAPDLSGVTETSGYYYICSEAGSATPNGAGTEPNTWGVGDWVIWNDDVGSGEWQKVDNSSVLSGVGTGQTLALWEGPSSVTDSETLGNAPITVSGNNTTFAGNVSLSDGILTVGADAAGHDVMFRGGTSGAYFTYDASEDGVVIVAPTDEVALGIRVVGGGQPTVPQFTVGRGTDQYLGIKVDDRISSVIHRQDETDAGTMQMNQEIWDSGTGIHKWNWKSADGAGASASTKMTLNKTGELNVSTSVTSTTFLGDLNGTINTATTGTTQAAANNSTLIATTAYADAAAAAVPIGDYLPLTGGTVTGNLTTNGVFTIQNTAPYIQWKDVAGTRLSYIQHNATNLVMSADIGQIQLDTAANNDILINPGGTGNVGIGTTNPNYKLTVSGGIAAGGVVTYSKYYSSLDTTGNAVAGLTTGSNGASAGFTFTCFGHTGKYQKIVYSCYNGTGTWYPKKVIDEGTNDFDVEASANATTITFTFKSTSGTKSYTPRVTVEATGSAINSTYA